MHSQKNHTYKSTLSAFNLHKTCLSLDLCYAVLVTVSVSHQSRAGGESEHMSNGDFDKVLILGTTIGLGRFLVSHQTICVL